MNALPSMGLVGRSRLDLHARLLLPARLDRAHVGGVIVSQGAQFQQAGVGPLGGHAGEQAAGRLQGRRRSGRPDCRQHPRWRPRPVPAARCAGAASSDSPAPASRGRRPVLERRTAPGGRRRPTPAPSPTGGPCSPESGDVGARRRAVRTPGSRPRSRLEFAASTARLPRVQRPLLLAPHARGEQRPGPDRAVSSSRFPGCMPRLRSTRAGSATPLSASPSVSSAPSVVCPPTSAVSASRNASTTPASRSRSSASVLSSGPAGTVTMASAERGSAPMA